MFFHNKKPKFEQEKIRKREYQNKYTFYNKSQQNHSIKFGEIGVQSLEFPYFHYIVFPTGT